MLLINKASQLYLCCFRCIEQWQPIKCQAPNLALFSKGASFEGEPACNQSKVVEIGIFTGFG